MRLTERRRQLIPQKGDAYLKEWLVICSEENTDGRARVTTDEEWVLPVD